MPMPTQFDRPIGSLSSRAVFFNGNISHQNSTLNKDKLAMEMNDKIKNFSSRFNNIIFLNRKDIFMPENFSTEGLPYSLDGEHMSLYGAKIAYYNFKSSSAYKKIVNNLKSLIHEQ
jgi:hypothetical protein